MKLITETLEEIHYLTEGDDKGGKSFFIEGVFMSANKVNRNRRVYPVETLKESVGKYIKEYVNNKRAFGELNHPNGPTVDLARASHLILDLKLSGDDYIGKAKIMETPMGNIVRSLIQEGARLGVSSRGMGSLQQKNGYNEVQPDFMLAAVDIVADPSAPGAFVNGIMEGKEWIWNNGMLEEKTVAEYQKVIKRASAVNLEKKAIGLFEDFLNKLK